MNLERLVYSEGELHMGCGNCEAKAKVDEKVVQVRIWINHLNKIDTNRIRSSAIYQCPECQTFWEVFAYEKFVKELNEEEAKNYSPDIQ